LRRARPIAGSGIGSAFVRQVLAEDRGLGGKLEPECAFVPAVLTKKP
jgi:hypothetical protein